MKRQIRNEHGALAIEAIFGITIFLITILSIMFLTLIIRLQANMQYALGQTAKEISGYYYLLDKVGIAAATAGGSGADVSEINKTIGYVLDFSDSASNVANGVNDSGILDGSFDYESLKKMPLNEIGDLHDKACSIEAQLEQLLEENDDPKAQITAVLSVFAKTMLNKGVSYYIAPVVCRAIMPRYLGGNKESTNKMLASVGIEGGINAIDFSGSQLLTDNRSIKLVAAYEVDLADFTFGLVHKTLVFRQVASTAAWIAPDGTNTYRLDQLEFPAIEDPDGEGDE